MTIYRIKGMVFKAQFSISSFALQQYMILISVNSFNNQANGVNSKLSSPARAMGSETESFRIGCMRQRLIKSQDIGLTRTAMTELKPKYKSY